MGGEGKEEEAGSGRLALLGSCISSLVSTSFLSLLAVPVLIRLSPSHSS